MCVGRRSPSLLYRKKMRRLVLILCVTSTLATLVAQVPPTVPAGWTTRTNADGAQVFSPGDLAPGQFEVTLFPPEAAPPSSGVRTWFEGRVRDEVARRGRPVSAGDVTMNASGALTANYTFTGRDGRRYLMVFSGAGRYSKTAFGTVEIHGDGRAAGSYIKQGAAILANGFSSALFSGPSASAPQSAPPATARNGRLSSKQIEQAITVTQAGTGVSARDIAFLLHRGEGRTTVTGYQYVESIDLLLKDGSAYTGLTIPPTDLNVEASRQLQPDKWTQWRRDASGFQLQNQSTDSWRTLRATVVQPLQPGASLNRVLEYKGAISYGGMGGTVFTKTLRFSNNGRYERENSNFRGTGPTQSSAGFSSGSYGSKNKNGSSGVASSSSSNSAGSVVASSSSKSAGQGDMSGTYSISGYTLELRADNGTVQRLLAFYVWPDKNKDDIYIGNATYSPPK